MKHGKGKLHSIDGSVFEGVWEGNLVKGTGVVNLPVGQGQFGGPTEVSMRYGSLLLLLYPVVEYKGVCILGYT